MRCIGFIHTVSALKADPAPHFGGGIASPPNQKQSINFQNASQASWPGHLINIFCAHQVAIS